MKITNKRGLHDYFIIDSLEAGVALRGAEVKAIREGRADLSQSYAKIMGEEAFLVNALIPRYHNAPMKDYDPQRTRKLLLHKSQIRNLIGKLSQTGTTLIPVSFYEKNNLIKVQLGLGKSKRQIDKRKIIKERDHERRVQQELRGKE
jgi:SsrA-binding protein